MNSSSIKNNNKGGRRKEREKGEMRKEDKKGALQRREEVLPPLLAR
jgi:hypothetical protein